MVTVGMSKNTGTKEKSIQKPTPSLFSPSIGFENNLMYIHYDYIVIRDGYCTPICMLA